MSAQTAMFLMSMVEFALWAVLGYLFWTKKLHHRFPAMGGYMALHVGSAPVLLFLIYGQSQHWFHELCFPIYFFVYWAVYIASAVLLYFICLEVFCSALSAFPGLMKLGIVTFRWAALSSVIVSSSTISCSHYGILFIPDVTYRLMRSVSVFELCLLGFVCLSMNAFLLPARDMAFGIALGFGLMSSSDFILSSFWSHKTLMTDPVQFVCESMILVALGMWVAYCAQAKPLNKLGLAPAASASLASTWRIPLRTSRKTEAIEEIPSCELSFPLFG
jgi:hypothetical protein